MTEKLIQLGLTSYELNWLDWSLGEILTHPKVFAKEYPTLEKLKVKVHKLRKKHGLSYHGNK